MKPSTQIAVATVAKSLLLTAIFFGARTYNALYSSPQCAMRLVNESDPVAYSKHPYWKDLTYDDSCEGEAMDQYIKNQYYNGEKWWVDAFVNTWTGAGACLAIYAVFRIGFSTRALFTGIFLIFFAYFAATIVLMHTHFEVDITYLCGGILHHARAEKPGIDFKGGSVTEGYLFCGFLNRMFYTYCVYWLLSKDSRFKKYSGLMAAGFVQLLLLFALTMVGKMHPVYHVMAINGSTPEMDNSWPYTAAWQAYKHCIVHHDNGLSFSGDVFLDPIWDAFLYAFAFFHNTVFKIQLGSFAHFFANTVADMAMGVVGVIILKAGLQIGLCFIPGSEGEAAKKLGKKTN